MLWEWDLRGSECSGTGSKEERSGAPAGVDVLTNLSLSRDFCNNVSAVPYCTLATIAERDLENPTTDVFWGKTIVDEAGISKGIASRRSV